MDFRLTERLQEISQSENGEIAMEFARKWIVFPVNEKTQREITDDLRTVDPDSKLNYCLGVIMKNTSDSDIVKQYYTFKFTRETPFTKLVDRYCLILAEMMTVAVSKASE